MDSFLHIWELKHQNIHVSLNLYWNGFRDDFNKDTVGPYLFGPPSCIFHTIKSLIPTSYDIYDRMTAKHAKPWQSCTLYQGGLISEATLTSDDCFWACSLNSFTYYLDAGGGSVFIIFVEEGTTSAS